MIEDIIIGMFLGMFLVAGPQIFFLFLKMRGQLSRALKKAGTTLEELDKKPVKTGEKKKGLIGRLLEDK